MSGPDPRQPEVGWAVDDRTFRETMGLFATGVSVIAAEIDGGVDAMTANAVSSVSLDPKLILFCPSRRARFSQLLPDVESFTVNFLRDEQQCLSTYFAGGWKEPTPPAYRFVHDGTAPRLQGALATLHCCKHAVYEAGDHWLVIGRVVRIHQGSDPHRPLLFFKGQYRALEPGQGIPGPDLTRVDDEPALIYYD
jgi:flavin reductase (DIM6/NTAB) family NADH-FMN oxidoreductase RutF